MAGAGAPERGPVHGRPGHRDRERRAALHQDRSRVLPAEPPMGDQRLRARLRRVPAPRRPRRRPARAASPLPRRPRRVHDRVARRRARVERGVADRRARGAGPRGGHHLARRALDSLDDVHRGPRAQRRARRLGRRRRLRRRSRRPARRRAHRSVELVVDLLRQRAGRRARVRARPAAAEREPRREHADLRLPGRCS